MRCLCEALNHAYTAFLWASGDARRTRRCRTMGLQLRVQPLRSLSLSGLRSSPVSNLLQDAKFCNSVRVQCFIDPRTASKKMSALVKREMENCFLVSAMLCSDSFWSAPRSARTFPDIILEDISLQTWCNSKYSIVFC